MIHIPPYIIPTGLHCGGEMDVFLAVPYFTLQLLKKYVRGSGKDLVLFPYDAKTATNI